MKRTVFDQILTVVECAERYHMNAKYIQGVLWRGTLLKEGVDYARKGNTYLILATSADRLWKHRTIPVAPGFRVCRKCLAVLPEDEGHFKRYSAKPHGLMHICRGCQSLQGAAHFQRNKARLRPIRTAYMRLYRREYPERNSVACRRYKLKRAWRRVQHGP